MLEHRQSAQSFKTASELDMLFRSLPVYGSPKFWYSIEQEDLPLEVLARVYRSAYVSGFPISDSQRLLTAILKRIHPRNSSWAQATIYKYCANRSGEFQMLADDLEADLYEELCRSLNHKVIFYWEVNFAQCLAYLRRRVRRAFMVHEGHWSNTNVKRGHRIPRELLTRIDAHAKTSTEHAAGPFDIEDERSHASLARIDMSDLHEYIARLPAHVRYIIGHIFWFDRTEKDTAQIMGISDRTVRNHLRKAFKDLSMQLKDGR